MGYLITSFNKIKESNSILSSSIYNSSCSGNKTTFLVKDFLSRDISSSDLGEEVGSINYVIKSDKYFIRTKALQPYSILPCISNESVEFVNPNSFKNHNLKAGDIIISKDSNIGEVVILDSDYPNYMLSGALYKLPVKEFYRYYLLAFLKTSFFKDQLYSMVPKGATIRHAGTKFLNCKIPLPLKNKNRTIKNIADIMKLIIMCEKEIKQKKSEIDLEIKNEIFPESILSKAPFDYPSIKEMSRNKRLDTGIYSKSFKTIEFAIKSYKNGFFKIPTGHMKSGNTPKDRTLSEIKSSSNYRWVTPTTSSDNGYLLLNSYIHIQVKNNINKTSVLLTNRTSRGGKGEYVGIALYYDIARYGKGHHNQGMYCISNYSEEDFVFITCYMNSKIIREYCSNLSVGSKMKEIKKDQFLNIPIPKVDNLFKKKIKKLFIGEEYNINLDFDISKIEEKIPFMGLYNLRFLQEYLDKKLSNMINDVIIDNM